MNLRNEKWMRQAACRGCADPEMFFDNHSIKAINLYCVICNARKRCLKFAQDNEISFGIWGGMTIKERKKNLMVLTK